MEIPTTFCSVDARKTNKQLRPANTKGGSAMR